VYQGELTILGQKSINYWLSIVFVASLLALFLIPMPSLGGTLAGHAVGIAGSVLLLMTLIYPFRKRLLGQRGRKNPISRHMTFGLLGSVLIVVHSGGYFTSLIVSLDFIILVAVAMSGIAGMFLFQRIRKTLKEYRQESADLKALFRHKRKEISEPELRRYFRFETDEKEQEEEHVDRELSEYAMRRCEELERLAEAIGDVTYSIQVYHTTQRLFSKWSLLHIHLAFFLIALMGTHIATSLYYGLPWVS